MAPHPAGPPGMGDRVPGIWVKGSNPPVLVVHPDGAEAARGTPEVARLVEAGRSVLMIDAFQTGSAVAPRDRSVKNFRRSTDRRCQPRAGHPPPPWPG